MGRQGGMAIGDASRAKPWIGCARSVPVDVRLFLRQCGVSVPEPRQHQYVTDRFATFFNRTPDGGGLSFSGATARCRSTSRHGARWSFRPLYELWSWTNALNN